MKRTASLLAVLLLAASCWGAETAPGTLRIGSKRFTESYILAHLMAQTVARATGSQPEVRQGLGNTAIVYEALRSGNIDLYPEYAGTIALEILKHPEPMTLAQMNAALAPLGLGAAIPLGFNDGYALAMRAADADRLGVQTVSDVARHPGLRFGLSNEFIGRADGWPGLAQRYGFRQQPIGLDHGLAYDAIAAGQVDLIDIYTTDAKIAHLKLRVLEDDRKYFPRYDALVLYRLEAAQRFPAAWVALRSLEGRIDEDAMIAMNARAELQSVPFDAIARDFLARAATTTGSTRVATAPASAASAPAPGRGFAAKLFGPDLARLTLQHLTLVAVSVAAAILIGVPLAVAAFARPRWRGALLAVAGLLQTVPSLALLAALIGLTGAIGALPALLALTLYALLPIMRNTVAGLAEVGEGIRQAGTALGMTQGQRLRHVELPLALPTVVAGIRTAIAIAIGTATIAAFIGAGGYGERIVTGLALNDRELLLAGALPAAALALLCEVLFELLERRMRRRQSPSPA
ncbi:MAG: transporter, substrate-binding protein [Ramlibacter sp.]|nr:transporter, substrate-binding protein [Ramlibacter sp.]